MSTPAPRPRVKEADARRPPFAGGVPVELADGQTWYLPRPVLGLLPETGPDGRPRFATKNVRSFGAEYQSMLDAFSETEDPIEEANALLSLAVDLLRRNYDLADADLYPLLPRYFGDGPNDSMWRAVADVALGIGPKPIPVG